MLSVRLRCLLFGEDVETTAQAIALGVVLFAALFGGTVTASDIFFDVVDSALVPALGLLALLAAGHTYSNQGVLVSTFVVIAPIYGGSIELVRTVSFGPSPLLEASLQAAPVALVLGSVVGLFGSVLGYAARRVVE